MWVPAPMAWHWPVAARCLGCSRVQSLPGVDLEARPQTVNLRAQRGEHHCNSAHVGLSRLREAANAGRSVYTPPLAQEWRWLRGPWGGVLVPHGRFWPPRGCASKAICQTAPHPKPINISWCGPISCVEAALPTRSASPHRPTAASQSLHTACVWPCAHASRAASGLPAAPQTPPRTAR